MPTGTTDRMRWLSAMQALKYGSFSVSLSDGCAPAKFIRIS